MTATQFEAWVESQTGDSSFELISGEICAKSMFIYPSVIASRVAGFLFIYLRQNKIGYLTGEAGGYRIGDDCYVPDVAFVSYAKQAHADKQGYNSVPPDLAVEVISDASNKRELRALCLKITGYLNVGMIVWVIDTEDKTVEVHQMGHAPKTLTVDDVLNAPELLPEFRLPVKDIFEE